MGDRMEQREPHAGEAWIGLEPPSRAPATMSAAQLGLLPPDTGPLRPIHQRLFRELQKDALAVDLRGRDPVGRGAPDRCAWRTLRSTALVGRLDAREAKQRVH